ncbi:hypothetical protein ACMU_13280 [Actibacterium mucosum KCTC 23349]|uniref:Cytochrome C n=1 Tax=Actibacterium mucosum KCTC 23349 TaxID=1454373 RepID=A0A037ZHP2_9RHOB|nr:c-type cytochrome biogenesis protein CcmI [Actibacterium mucosum]KAJ55658.1 hypothetical protein ACMU_13280 [Actibacterium mucosum KCTC 23349]
MEFWLVATGLVAIVAISLIVALMRGRPVGTDTAPDMQVYKDQLSEIQRDLDRGVLNETEAERTRVEIARRALEADKAAQAMSAGAALPRPVTLGLSVLVLMVLIGGTGAVYWQLGAPGYADLPLEIRKASAEERRATRMSQAEAEAQLPPAPLITPEDPDTAALIKQLRDVVAERPDDERGLTLLAGYEGWLGNFKAAYTAIGQVILIRGDEAQAEDYVALTEMMVQAAGGYVSPEAEAAIEQVLARDPNNGAARYFLGLMYAQNDRPDVAFRLWRILLNESTPQAPWYPVLISELPGLAEAAGARFTPPQEASSAPGPSAEDMAAAAEMAPEDREAMIRGMVEGLADELATQGGPADKWARLIRALGVLGETDRAQAIYEEALSVFAGQDSDIGQLTTAAQSIGLAE